MIIIYLFINKCIFRKKITFENFRNNKDKCKMKTSETYYCKLSNNEDYLRRCFY